MPRQVTVHVLDNTRFRPDYVGFKEQVYLPQTLQDYSELWAEIEKARHEDIQRWRAMMRLWSAADQYFLLIFILRVGRDAKNSFRKELHFWHPSHLELSRSVQFGVGRRLYVCSRELGKSTHITHTNNIHRKILDPNDSTCIFSLTRELAEDHLGGIKTELKENGLLKETWRDRFYWTPEKAGVPWGLKEGLRIKRSTTRPEESFEARSFATRLPTGMHYDRRYYDDIEADSTVNSEVTMKTAEDRFVSSQDLRSDDGDDIVLGTYYHQAGPLRQIERVYNRRLIIYAGEDTSPSATEGLKKSEAGPLGGRPSHGFTREQLWKIWYDKGCDKKSSSRVSYGRQVACDPLSGETSRLPLSLIRYYDEDPRSLVNGMSVYVCLDPAPGTTRDNEVSVGGDPSFCWVWMLRPDRTYVWIDGWRERLAPSRRMHRVYQTVLEWQQMGADVRAIRIEQYGPTEYCQQQIAHNEYRGLRTRVERCSDVGKLKRDREFERWENLLSEGVWFPRHMMRESDDGRIDLVEHMVQNELADFPQPATDDGLDAGGLIMEPTSGEVKALVWPAPRTEMRYQIYEPRVTPGFMEGGVV